MRLATLIVLQPFAAGADRHVPIRAHLTIFIARFQRVVIERVRLALRAARGPDHRLVGVGEAATAKVRHRVGLAPDDVVENPEAQILHDGADAENVVVGADHEDCRVRLHEAARFGQPFAGEAIIFGEAGEFVPIVVDGVNDALVRAREGAFQREIVGWVGKNQIR